MRQNGGNMNNYNLIGFESDFMEKLKGTIKPLNEMSKLRQENDHFQKVISVNDFKNLSEERNRKDAVIMSCAMGIVYFMFAMSIVPIYSKNFIGIFITSGIITMIGILITFIMYFNSRETFRIKKSNIVKNAEEQIFRINQRVNEILNQYENDFQILPPDYQYSIAAEYIYKCFLNQRAATISEAVNLFEEQLHRWKIENYHQQLMNIQYQQQCTMEAVKRNSAISAGASVANLFVSIASKV